MEESLKEDHSRRKYNEGKRFDKRFKETLRDNEKPYAYLEQDKQRFKEKGFEDCRWDRQGQFHPVSWDHVLKGSGP